MSQTIDLGKVVPIKGTDYWTPDEQQEIENAKTAANTAAASANEAASAANAGAGKVNDAIAEQKARVDDGLSDLDTYKQASTEAANNANAKAALADNAATNATAAAATAAKATKEMDETAQADHAQAQSDSKTAGDDHTIAESDHKISEAQQTTFETNEAAREKKAKDDRDAEDATFQSKEAARDAAIAAVTELEDQVDENTENITDLALAVGEIIEEATDGVESLSFTDADGNTAMQVKEGHIKTKNFDSRNLVTTEYVDEKLAEANTYTDNAKSETESDIAILESNVAEIDNTDKDAESVAIIDEDNNCVMQIKDGDVKTKNFDSAYSVQDDNIDETLPSLSIVDDKDNCIAQFKEGEIKTKYFDSSKVKVSENKITDFSSFLNNGSWTVSEDNKTAYTESTGISNALISKETFHANKFNIDCALCPEGDTFEVCFGKKDYTAGTIFSLKYDGTNSILNIYGDDNNTLSLSKSLTLTDVSFANGKKIHIRITKKTEAHSYFNVELTDDYGNYQLLENIYQDETTTNTNDEGAGSAMGYGWGKTCVFMLSGSKLTANNVCVSFPIENDLRLICLGHSYMEGNSVYDHKNETFSSIVCDEIGYGKTLNLGQGGQKASDLAPFTKTYAEWFYNAKYALINIGGNDFLATPTEANQTKCIGYMQQISDCLKAYKIIPVWILDGGWLINKDDDLSIYWNWILSQEHYVDIRKAFPCEADSYLSDGKHPTLATHAKIAKCIKAQASYMFNF